MYPSIPEARKVEEEEMTAKRRVRVYGRHSSNFYAPQHIRTRRPSRSTIIVTGTPGTGKTTFSKNLAKELGAYYIPLTQFVLNRKLYSGFDSRRKTRIVNLARARASLRVLLTAPGSTIVDTHLPEGVVPESFVRLVFVLRCHPRTLEKRLARKRWNSDKIRENVLAEILDACLTSAIKCYGRRRVAQLNTSHISVGKCVSKAKRFLRGNVPKTVKVDWIETLEKENSLDRYLG